MQPIDDVLRTTLELIATRRRLPESTYRLQFHAGFTFRNAREIVPYLHDLGITHCYASPYLKATPGSTHGYDVIDHRTLNPEIGSNEDYASWTGTLREHGMSHILDIVPNHVGVGTSGNPWWNDVLEHGPASRYADYFDIDWRGSPRPELHDKVLLPILGFPYADVLEQGQLRLAFENGQFYIRYYDRRFPTDPSSWSMILEHDLDQLQRALGPEVPTLQEYQSILTAIAHLPHRSDRQPTKILERRREAQIIKHRLAALAAHSAPVHQLIEYTVAIFNGSPGNRHSFDLLDDLLNRQGYRLSDWHVASDEINYRRFFDINDLAAVRMEILDVFQTTHELILRLLGQGIPAGLRVDHPDGLFDPKLYFQWLQQHYVVACAKEVVATDPQFQGLEWNDLQPAILEQLHNTTTKLAASPPSWPLYVVAEKILAFDEPLPEGWAIHGTSGYDFLNRLNGLFIDPANAPALTSLYHDWVGNNAAFPDVAYQTKLLILKTSLASELHMLAHQLDRLAQKDRHSRDFTLNGLRHALREVIACFPVYRSYISDRGAHDSDRQYIEAAVHAAIQRNPRISPSIFHFVRDVLLLRYPESFTEQDRADQRRFAGKFQQLTAPATAKGIEDTAFYTYNRLVSLNEVGGDPGQFGTTPQSLHRYLQDRQMNWPFGLSPLSTHDTKRSEDVRARINVLSEVPTDWRECVLRWRQLNALCRLNVASLSVPDPNAEYLLYQTLVGAWPLDPCPAEEYATFITRIQAYMTKALREAKVHTSWTTPNTDYENATAEFIARILDPQISQPFLRDFRAFQTRISHYGLLNSLAQTLLRITAPGVPDTYQGTELWDFSLVDPDNRRPIDYDRRCQLLHDLRTRFQAADPDRSSLAQHLTRTLHDSRIKLFITWQALSCRRDHPELFTTGQYLPAEVVGPQADHAFAFARHHADHWALAVVPRLLTSLLPQTGTLPLGPETWHDTAIRLPMDNPPLSLRNIFTGEPLSWVKYGNYPTLQLADVFAHFPVALFCSP
ncbi:MAG: malto-oligosyltrehalose synthase [Bacillota bacterium]